jgi:protein-S-isoprenylcysteine O-methyltransferase Ste14
MKAKIIEEFSNMKKTKGSHSKVARILETSILIVLPVLLHYLIPVMILIPQPYSYLGAVLMILALVLMTRASTLFRKAENSFELKEGGSSLIISGPFQFSRNPMYLGMLLWLTGLAVLLGSLIAFLFPVLFFLLVNFFVIPREEKDLEQKLGGQYVEYKGRVRRWF